VILLDSSARLEVLTRGPNSSAFEQYVEEANQILVPTIVLEVYKIIRRRRPEEDAEEAAFLLTGHLLIDLDDCMALAAAETSLERGLAMADATVYTTAQLHDATLVTGDADFEGLPGVEYIPAPSAASGNADQ